MTVLNLTQPSKSSGSGIARPVLPTDIYRMKILESKLEDDTFANARPDGTMPQNIVLTFEITTLTEEQQDKAAELDEEWDDVRIWHRINPYYALVKDGGPSKFKGFIDDLVEWGLYTFNPESFEVESLAGIELKCSVLNYKKTKGVNAGQPGNKITGFAAVRVKSARRKNAPEPVTVDQPQAVDEDTDLF